MPRVHNHRSRRSTIRRKHSRTNFTVVQAAFFLMIGGLVLAWWLNSTPTIAITPNLALQPYTVTGPPSISADFINQVLDHYHSPAAGKGQVMYDDGVKYGIDPVYALAFFMHESTFGTRGVATVTHSLGNIRTTPGYQDFDGYRRYSTWEEGFEDWYKLIANLYVGQWGLRTVDEIIPRYAPSSDNNDEAAYIQSVKNAVDTWRSGVIDV